MTLPNMTKLFSALTVLMAATLLTACTKCSQDKPVEPPPPVVEPQTPPPTEGAVPPAETVNPPPTTVDTPAEEAAPAK